MTPERTCVGCGRKAPQHELLRFVAADGTLRLDPSRSSPGRGAYTHPRLACFERAVARRAFSRTLRRTVKIPENLVHELDRR
ncbi:MAG: YlxR family protein [Gaiellaceae bacterium]